MDALSSANDRTSRQERTTPAAKPIANILSSSSFSNFVEDAVVDLVGTHNGGPDDVSDGHTEENPPAARAGLAGTCIEFWLDRDVEEFGDYATVAALPWVADWLKLHPFPLSRTQKGWVRAAAASGRLNKQWIPPTGDLFGVPVRGRGGDQHADPTPRARVSVNLDMEDEAEDAEEARETLRESERAAQHQVDVVNLAALIRARPPAPERASAGIERAMRTRTSPTVAAPAGGSGGSGEAATPGPAETTAEALAAAAAEGQAAAAAEEAAAAAAAAVASTYAEWEAEVARRQEGISEERGARARRAETRAGLAESASASRAERRARAAAGAAAAEQTPRRASGPGECPFTVQPRESKSAKPAETTAKNVNEQIALAQLRRKVTGALHSIGVQFPELTKLQCPLGVVPAREIPDNLLSDFLTRLSANAALMKVIIAGFDTARNGEGASFATGILDQTLCGVVARGGYEDLTSPNDIMHGFLATSSLTLIQARHLFVAPAATPGARQLRTLLQTMSLLDRDNNLDFVSASSKIQTAVAAAGNKKGDNDYHLNVKELMGMCAEAENKVFEFTWLGEAHVWSTYAQKLTDGAAERANRSYGADEFSDIVRTIVKYGDAQSRRNRGRVGAMEGRARHQAGNVLMLSGDGRGSGDGAGSEWGSTFDADYLDSEDALEVRYIAVACKNPECGQQLNPQFPNCMTCGWKQDGTWLCTDCHMETRGDGDRCRYAFGGGCPGTRARGRAPTPAESEASLAVSRQVQAEQRSRQDWGPSPRPAGKGKGQGGKGGRVLKLGAPARGGGGGGGSGGSGGGGGGGGGSGGASHNEFRLVLQAEVDRVIASGGTSTMSADALTRAVGNIRRATQGC
jgi:hypothetical protein